MISIFGYSDDLVEIEGDISGEYGGESRVILGNEDFGGVVVEMRYVSPGLWGATIRQIEEDVPIPWDISVTHLGYSVMVNIDVPNPKEVALVVESLEA